MSTSSALGSDELAFAGVVDQTERLARGEVSSRELVESALARINAAQPVLNAFRCVRDENALAEADAADRRRAAGDSAPLLGVPIAIKDDIDLAGEPTAFGCPGSFEAKHEDSEAVRRLRVAGAVIVGKTNTPEFGQWPFTEGTAFGATRNPWNTDHTPGGSSGGSAAAVAAAHVPAALGSDGLGSIRVPAAWTHLVGIKPQRGRISTWPEAEAFHGLTCIGPLARRVGDAALLLDAVAGNHPSDPHRPPAPAVPLAAAPRRDPGRLRVALSFRAPYALAPIRLDREVRAATERIGRVLEGLGQDVSEAEPRYGVLGIGVLPRSIRGVYEWSGRVPDRSLLDERTRQTAALGRFLGGPVLRAARALEPAMRLQVGAIFRRYDVVLTPTTAQPPPPIGVIDGLSSWETDKLMVAACPYTWPWNVLGWPAISVPAGFTSAGLPVGVQLIGPAGSEARLISLAAALERVEKWHERRPPNRVPQPASGARS